MQYEIKVGTHTVKTNSKFVMDTYLSPIAEQATNPGESDIRKRLIDVVNTLTGKDYIMVDGNSVYSPKKIIRDFKKFYKSVSADNLSDYLYQFFTNRCGTSAYYDKFGWVDNYSTKSDIKELIEGVNNSSWNYDSNFIIGELRKII